MIRLQVDFLPTSRTNDVAIVIDALRMTTTASAMLTSGYRDIRVVADVDAAHAVAASTGAPLFGERGGVALPGFAGGNSPLEHSERVTGDVGTVLCTTNGSLAVETTQARHLLLGAIVNARAVARRALDLASDGITIVCAGSDGEPALEDVVAAGYVLRALQQAEPRTEVSDSCVMALDVAAASPDPTTGLRRAHHAQRLIALGFTDDIVFASDLDRLDMVPERSAGHPATFVAAPRSSD